MFPSLSLHLSSLHSPSATHETSSFTAKVHTALPYFGHHCDSSSSARSAYPRAFTEKKHGTVLGPVVFFWGDAETT